VFFRLNDGKPLPKKKSEEGDLFRRHLLERQGFRDLDAWLSVKRIGTGAKRDDVLDACAVALAARDVAKRIPEEAPPIDAYRLPMQIWF
jgi:predicted RNase H-like nuclease